jgi:Ca2+-binding RTX toxin-like protein
VNTGEGNDIITGNSSNYSYALANFGFMDTGEGNDIITGSNIDEADGILDTVGIGLLNGGEFDGFMYTGDNNDTITGIATAEDGIGLINSTTYIIDTGNGNDIITGTGNRYGIVNDGTINTGNGNDSIIANGGFDVGTYGIGSVFLGNGKDYLKGFGNGSFNGENGEDTLELTPGSYTIDISETTVNFTQPSSSPFSNRRVIMITSEFEKLIAGGTTYDFSSLTNGQIISVA